MNHLNDLELIIADLSPVKSTAIFLPENPKFDQVAAALALFLSLEKANKIVSLVCSSPMTVGFSHLVGLDKIRSEITGRSLVISFDYQENSIDKVSYNIENQKFNLVIQPKSSSPPLSTENVNFTYSGQTERLLTLGVPSLESLGVIYHQEEKIFTRDQILNLDINANNNRYGKINAIFPQMSSYSEVIASLLEAANYPVDQDIANNLLLGLQRATNNFTAEKTTAEAFAAAAFCLRAGAKRQPLLPRPLRPKEKKKFDLSLKTMTAGESARRPPTQPSSEEENNEEPVSENNPPVTPAPDWFAPKVFRGTRQV